MSDRAVRIGTRGSKLARWQTDLAERLLREAHDGLVAEQIRISTAGDRDRAASLAQIGGTGLFVKDIEAALLAGRIDLAVHSLKDLPTTQPEGLALAAVLAREDPHDVLVTRDGVSLDELPGGATIGTSSPRRKAQLLRARPDLAVSPLRGNVPTRVAAVAEGAIDGAVLAQAGLARLGLADEATTWPIPFDVMLPAPGQGAIAVEIREGDERLSELLAPLNHAETQTCVRAERDVMRILGGGCHTPMGALATLRAGRLCLNATVAAPDGSRVVRHTAHGTQSEPDALAAEVALALLNAGAADLLPSGEAADE